MNSFNRMSIAAFLAVAGLISVSPAQADVDCSGVPTYIGMDSNGYMAASWGWGAVNLCNVNTAITYTPGQTALTPDGCKALYSMLLTALNTGQTFYLHVSGITSCSAIRDPNNWPAGPYPYWWEQS